MEPRYPAAVVAARAPLLGAEGARARGGQPRSLWPSCSRYFRHACLRQRRGLAQGARAPLATAHGATRWPAAPAPPQPPGGTPAASLSPAALGVRVPNRGQPQSLIITSIVPSGRLELELVVLGAGLRLRRRLRSAVHARTALGSFTMLFPPAPSLWRWRATWDSPASSRLSPAALATPPGGPSDPQRVATSAPRTASRPQVPR